MQLFPSIHTISLWVNNLAMHEASSWCFERAITMVTGLLPHHVKWHALRVEVRSKITLESIGGC